MLCEKTVRWVDCGGGHCEQSCGYSGLSEKILDIEKICNTTLFVQGFSCKTTWFMRVDDTTLSAMLVFAYVFSVVFYFVLQRVTYCAWLL